MLQTLTPILQKTTKRGRKAKSRPVFVSKRIELQYAKALLEIVHYGEDLLKQHLTLKPVVNDGLIGDGFWQGWFDILAMIKTTYFNFVDGIAGTLAENVVKKQKTATDKQLSEQVQKVTGLDLSAVLRDEEIQDEFEQALLANISLIKSIPQQYMDKVEQAILHGVQTGLSTKDITQNIKKITQLTENRAKLIATDQVAKINSSLSRVRQQNLGITHYTWSTSQDERVRHEHRVRNGKLFAWDNSPSGGHPGMAIRCRCVAIPYMEHLIDENTPTPKELMKQGSK